MRNLIVVLFFATISTMVYSQSYNTAFGFKFGDDLKFSGIQRIGNRTTIEANFSDGLFSDHKLASLTLRKHHSLLTKRVNLFVGAGYYGQSLKENDDVEKFKYDNHGLLGTMGFEFTIGRINISMDYSPQYSLSKNYTGRKLTADSGLSVKYVLWSRESKSKKLIKKIF